MVERDKDTAELLRQLRARGWRVEMTARRHYMAYSPCGRTVVQFARSGDWRALRNTVARFKRAGLELPL